ncbi:MAG TPA: hypothetical protein VF407_18490, partial [Polyangiaceae bacterium]
MLRIKRRSATARSGFKPSIVRAGLAVLLLVLASCASGSGCGGCGGTIPGGFPRASVIENAGAVRITRSGLDQLATNLPAVVSKLLNSSGDVVQYPIPKTDGSVNIVVTDYDYTICSTGPDAGTTPPHCIVEIEVGKTILHLDAVSPNNVVVSGTVPIRMQDLPVKGDVIGTIGVSFGQNQTCNGATAGADYKAFPISVSIPVITETNAPRDGYTKLDMANAVISVGVDEDDVKLCVDCGILSAACNGIAGGVKDLAFKSLKNGVVSTLQSTLTNALCTKSDTTVTPSCPTGTNDVSGTCR